MTPQKKSLLSKIHTARYHCPAPLLVPLLLDWFAQNARDLPWRRTRDPYAVWVSEIMLQQTQVKTVIPYWERWLRDLPDLATLAAAPSEKIHKLWEGLGYYTRVRNLQKAAQQLVTNHAAHFPENFSDVLTLPGIGRYTAGAICSIAFNQPTPILDGNVMRVLTRVRGLAGDPREKSVNTKLWQLAQSLVETAHTLPANRASAFGNCSALNQSLMELGALICTPRQPRCEACPLREHCVAHQENRVAEFPQITARARITPRRFVALVAKHRDTFLVRQRPAKVVNAQLWEFPNVEIKEKDLVNAPLLREHFPFALETFTPLCVIKHSITRYRITVETFLAIAKKPHTNPGHWLTLSELAQLPFTSAHRKILNQL